VDNLLLNSFTDSPMFIYLVKDLLYGDVVVFYKLNSTYFPWLLLTATSIDRDQVFVGASRNAPRNAVYRFLDFLGHLLLFFMCLESS
jgi:hypothetical protein